MTTARIDTDRFSAQLRSRVARNGQFLLASLAGSEQEADITEPVNCGGAGRVRHFVRQTGDGWPANPLPIDPAAKSLGLPPGDLIRAQVFQLAACNWRCWYCYVPFNLLSANEADGRWLSAEEMVSMYLGLKDRPPILDLSGGQPDLAPEWIAAVIRSVDESGASGDVYIWSDDNLSNDYLWRYLSAKTRRIMSRRRNYGRVACFKGFDQSSFAFNTGADEGLFARQFELFQRLLDLEIDLYAYATFTSDGRTDVVEGVASFIDRLGQISRYLPLRTIPLEIRDYAPSIARASQEVRDLAYRCQRQAVAAWSTELKRRFSDAELATPICDLAL